MNYSKLGCVGLSVQFLLVCLNSFFLVVSALVFVATCALKWGSSFSKLIVINNSSIEVDKLGGVTTCVLVISGFGFALSLTGLLGACRKNRFFLIVYGAVLLCLFLIKCVAIVVLLGFRTSIENDFKSELNTTFSHVKTQGDTSCNEMRALSQIFDCCGFNSASDFITPSLAASCCNNYNPKSPQPGCAYKVVNVVESVALYLLIIPCFILLAIELGVLIFLPILVARIGREPERMPLYNPYKE